MPSSRASGILLHPTSLPGRFGIGDLGSAAYRFVDFLHASGQQLWQLMPLGPTSFGDSPYQALSALAGNPLLINLEQLVNDRCLAWWDFDRAPAFPEDRVDYGAVIEFKQRMLRLAFTNFQHEADPELRSALDDFMAAHAAWLDDFALFMALKEHYGGAEWSAWEPDIAIRRPDALARWRAELADEVAYQQFVQFLFFRQWGALKAYANDHGVRVVGDIPIFVAYDSADAWAHPEYFYFDETGHPTLLAGVPPDFFSPTGQLWGNPLYRWDAMAADGYAWWIARLRMTLQMVDVVRLDHFRGFEAYYAVPAADETAENGEWIEGPGLALFRALEEALGPLPLIAEDLGLITPEVQELRLALGIPGMKVLQFAFAGDPDSLYLPHNYEHDFVVYTGTHDNDTALGWFRSLGPEERRTVQRYIERHGDEINWDLIRLAMMSVADTAIFPLQDVLGIGSEGRMNMPGQAAGNWGWRYREWMLNDWVRNRLGDLTEIFGRAPRLPEDEEETLAEASG